jgi:cytochrome c5
MKQKITLLALLSVLIYSCSPSKSTTKPVEETVVVVAEPAKPILTEEILAGKTSYENNCAKCHKLYDTKQFTAEEWTPIMLRMQKKAHIDDAERDRIYAYVTMK